MDDLITWIKDCLSEDERVARVAGRIVAKYNDRYFDVANIDESFAGTFEEGLGGSPRWLYIGREPSATGKTFRPSQVRSDNDFAVARAPEHEAIHIALHDPARVLREVESKRKIVKVHEGIHSCGFSDYDDDDPCDTLKLLALPYSDRPGYRSEWAL